MSDDEPREVEAQATGSEDQGDAPLSETEAMLRDAKQRKVRALLAVGGALVVAAGATAIGLVVSQRDKDRKVAEGLGALNRCLWGEALAEGQTPGARVRAGQLATMGLAPNQGAVRAAPPWPMRCASPAFALHERLVDAGHAEGEGKALDDAAVALAKALEDPKSVFAPIAPLVERVLEQAAHAGITAAAPPSPGDAPPIGQVPFSVDAFAKLGPLSTKPVALTALSAEAITDDELRLVLRDSDQGPLLCTFGPASAACRALPPSTKGAPALRLAGTVEPSAAPLLLGDRDGRAGIFRFEGGEKIAGGPIYGAYAKKDGAFITVGFDDKRDRIHVLRRVGNAVTEDRVDPGGNTGNGYYNLGLLWDQLVWKAVKDERIHMFARKVSTEGELVGPLADLGQISEPSLVENKEGEEPHVTGCRTKEALVARVKGWENQFLLFHTNGQWSFPVKVWGTGGTLACRGGEATVTWITESIAGGGGEVQETRCVASGCKEAKAKGEALVGVVREIAPVDAVQTAAADLDGQLLFVWIAGEGGGLRMKLAPIEKIREAPQVVLFDPLIREGKLAPSSTLYDMRLFVRGGVGWLVIDTSAGVHAIRIDADGKASPVNVKR